MIFRKFMPVFAIAIGLVLAVGTSGFKSASNAASFGMHTFQYTAPGGSYAQTDVQDPANWSLVASTSRCNDQNVKACRIFVPEDDLIPSGNTFLLPQDFLIAASSGSTSYVISTDAGSGSAYISNKSGL